MGSAESGYAQSHVCSQFLRRYVGFVLFCFFLLSVDLDVVFWSVVGDWLPGVLAGFLGGGCGGGCHWRLFAAAVAFLLCALLIVCV